jgi:hypothetical protein
MKGKHAISAEGRDKKKGGQEADYVVGEAGDCKTICASLFPFLSQE